MKRALKDTTAFTRPPPKNFPSKVLVRFDTQQESEAITLILGVIAAPIGWRLFRMGALPSAALAGLVYANALTNPFVYDDHRTIVENASILSLAEWRRIVEPLHESARRLGFTLALEPVPRKMDPGDFPYLCATQEVVDRVPTFYSIGHLLVPGGGTRKPTGKYVVAMNKITKDRYLGTGPARYITEVRVREAASLLRGSGLTIEEIPEQTGFPNRFYFSRVFKKMTRYSPADFRSKFRLPAQNP